MASAIQDYLQRTEARIEELQKQITFLTSENKTQQAEVTFKKKQHADLNAQIVQQKEALASLQQEHGHLVRRLAETQDRFEKTQTELKDLTAQLHALAEKGITPDLVTQIHELDVQTGEALLTRIRSLEAYHQTTRDLAKKKSEVASHHKTLQGLKNEEKAVLQAIQNQRSTLDDWQARTRTVQEAVKIVTSFFTGGYTTEHLGSLKSGLDIIGIKERPERSLQRLITALEKAQSLEGLNQELTELATLQTNLAKAKGDLLAIRGTGIQIIEEATANAVNQLEHLSKRAEKHIQDLGNQWQARERVLEQSIERSLSHAAQTTKGIAATLEKRTSKAYNALEEHVSLTLQRFSEEGSTIFQNHAEQITRLQQTVQHECITTLQSLHTMVDETKRGITEVRDYVAVRSNL